MTKPFEVICHLAACTRLDCQKLGRCQADGWDAEPGPVYLDRDDGPWTASADGRILESADFTHDVRLQVSGDFASDAQRKRYADNLAKKLNIPLQGET